MDVSYLMILVLFFFFVFFFFVFHFRFLEGELVLESWRRLWRGTL